MAGLDAQSLVVHASAMNAVRGVTALVTGANRGIGLEYCRQLQARGDQVVAVCREPSPELMALGVRIESAVELTDADAIAALVQRLEGLRLDLVILNAGILQSMGLSDLDVDSIRQQFEVNALAPLQLSRALVPQMPPGSKLALMTSRMGSIDDNSSGGSYGYRMSKAALNSLEYSSFHSQRSLSWIYFMNFGGSLPG